MFVVNIVAMAVVDVVFLVSEMAAVVTTLGVVVQVVLALSDPSTRLAEGSMCAYIISKVKTYTGELGSRCQLLSWAQM